MGQHEKRSFRGAHAGPVILLCDRRSSDTIQVSTHARCCLDTAYSLSRMLDPSVFHLSRVLG
jgi:hypothetical protein